MKPFEVIWTEGAAQDWAALDADHKEQVRRLIAYIKHVRGGGWFWGVSPAGRRLWYVSSSSAQVIFMHNYTHDADEVVITALGTWSIDELLGDERDPGQS